MKTSHALMLGLLMFISLFISYALGYNNALDEFNKRVPHIKKNAEAKARESVGNMYLTLVNNPRTLKDQLIYECVVYGDCEQASYLLNNK